MMTVTEFATKRGCSTQYIRKMLAQGRIAGAIKVSVLWLIPEDAKIEKEKKERKAS